MENTISRKMIADVIVDALWIGETKSGRFGDYYWRVIVTSDGSELDFCHTDEFDRWANSNYQVLDYEEFDFSEICERLFNLFNS